MVLITLKFLELVDANKDPSNIRLPPASTTIGDGSAVTMALSLADDTSRWALVTRPNLLLKSS